jgi:MFS family permease
MRDRGTPPSATIMARAALALYPPSWQSRYGDEVHALLDESGGGARAIASVAWYALPAWIWPPRHLYDGPARMRASLATGLVAWSFLVGLGLVFAQLTQFQGYRPDGHPVIAWSYLVFDAALALSLLAAGLGGLPLWLLMLRRALRERRRRDPVYLLLPVIAPAAYLVGLRVALQFVRGTQGVSPSWFGIIILAGFAAAAVAAAGPGLALRRLRPRGPALRLAAVAGGAAAAAIVVAAVAIFVAVIGLSAWARGFAGYQDATLPGVYLALVVATAAVTAVSAARGARAALAEQAGGAPMAGG